MDKAVEDFIINNLKNAALSIIDEVENQKVICRMSSKIDDFHTYTRMMLITGRVIRLEDNKNPEKSHLTGYLSLLEKIISILIIDMYGRKKFSSICRRARHMVEKYADPEEEVKLDRKTVYKILAGEE